MRERRGGRRAEGHLDILPVDVHFLRFAIDANGLDHPGFEIAGGESGDDARLAHIAVSQQQDLYPPHRGV
jgi:hypothetical protein